MVKLAGKESVFEEREMPSPPALLTLRSVLLAIFHAPALLFSFYPFIPTREKKVRGCGKRVYIHVQRCPASQPAASQKQRLHTRIHVAQKEVSPRKKSLQCVHNFFFPALSLVVLFLYPSFRAPVNNGFSAHHGRDRWFRVPLAVSYIRLDGFSATQCVRRRVQFAVGPKCNRS